MTQDRHRVLGIDPGTACGWALLDNGARVASGTWDLGIRKGESKGMRFLRLENQLLDALNTSKPRLVAYEMTGHLKGYANEVYFGIVGIIRLVCERAGVDYSEVRNTEVKKRATGKGNANKEVMLAAARARFGPVQTEDEADALWIALCGTELLAREVA